MSANSAVRRSRMGGRFVRNAARRKFTYKLRLLTLELQRL
jgi:hypothetical protein